MGNLRSEAVQDKPVDVELVRKGGSYMDKDHQKVSMPLGERTSTFSPQCAES